jgi:hypothetical protein
MPPVLALSWNNGQNLLHLTPDALSALGLLGVGMRLREGDQAPTLRVGAVPAHGSPDKLKVSAIIFRTHMRSGIVRWCNLRISVQLYEIDTNTAAATFARETVLGNN